jgi:Flp pilus assembly protein TadG
MRLARVRQRRPGLTIVESTFVLSICLLFLFGIFEYGRYMMLLQVMTNAAREGARFAAVTTNDANANPTLDVQTYTLQSLAGQDGQLTGTNGASFDSTTQIQVYRCDPTTFVPVDASGNAVSDWTQAPYTNAGFGQTIAVTIRGNFTPALPNFLLMGTSIPIQTTAIMYSEAN